MELSVVIGETFAGESAHNVGSRTDTPHSFLSWEGSAMPTVVGSESTRTPLETITKILAAVASSFTAMTLS